MYHFVEIVLFCMLLQFSSGSTLPAPVFGETPDVVTFREGETATLPCIVHNRGTKLVYWKKHSQSYPIAVGTYVFVSDERFELQQPRGTDEWNLVIHNVRAEDYGEYNCLIGTSHAPMAKTTTLDIIETRATAEEGVDCTDLFGRLAPCREMLLYDLERSPDMCSYISGMDLMKEECENCITVISGECMDNHDSEHLATVYTQYACEHPHNEEFIFNGIEPIESHEEFTTSTCLNMEDVIRKMGIECRHAAGDFKGSFFDFDPVSVCQSGGLERLVECAIKSSDECRTNSNISAQIDQWVNTADLRDAVKMMCSDPQGLTKDIACVKELANDSSVRQCVTRAFNYLQVEPPRNNQFNEEYCSITEVVVDCLRYSSRPCTNVLYAHVDNFLDLIRPPACRNKALCVPHQMEYCVYTRGVTLIHGMQRYGHAKFDAETVITNMCKLPECSRFGRGCNESSPIMNFPRELVDIFNVGADFLCDGEGQQALLDLESCINTDAWYGYMSCAIAAGESVNMCDGMDAYREAAEDCSSKHLFNSGSCGPTAEEAFNIIAQKTFELLPDVCAVFQGSDDNQKETKPDLKHPSIQCNNLDDVVKNILIRCEDRGRHFIDLLDSDPAAVCRSSSMMGLVECAINAADECRSNTEVSAQLDKWVNTDDLREVVNRLCSHPEDFASDVNCVEKLVKSSGTPGCMAQAHEKIKAGSKDLQLSKAYCSISEVLADCFRYSSLPCTAELYSRADYIIRLIRPPGCRNQALCVPFQMHYCMYTRSMTLVGGFEKFGGKQFDAEEIVENMCKFTDGKILSTRGEPPSNYEQVSALQDHISGLDYTLLNTEGVPKCSRFTEGCNATTDIPTVLWDLVHDATGFLCNGEGRQALHDLEPCVNDVAWQGYMKCAKEAGRSVNMCQGLDTYRQAAKDCSSEHLFNPGNCGPAAKEAFSVIASKTFELLPDVCAVFGGSNGNGGTGRETRGLPEVAFGGFHRRMFGF